MRTQFSSRRGLGCLRVAMEHDLCKNIGNINVCIDFKMLKVKVPMIFLCIVGFLLPREGHYMLRIRKA